MLMKGNRISACGYEQIFHGVRQRVRSHPRSGHWSRETSILIFGGGLSLNCGRDVVLFGRGSIPVATVIMVVHH